MRIFWVAFVFFLFSAVLATAQTQHRQVGGKAGVTAASPSYESAADDEGYGNRVFVSGGGFLVQRLRGPLALQVEALFVPKGGELDPHDSAHTLHTLILDYLEIPALLRIAPVRSSSHSVYLFAGPAAGLRLDAKFRTAVGRPVTSGVEENISSNVKAYEFSLVAGGGVDIGRHAIVDARYDWGLTNVNRGAESGHGIYNRAFTVLAGFRY
jgi:hypothetical protein